MLAKDLSDGKKEEFKAKMANNVSVKCVGVCRNVKIVVCGIKVGVDL